MKRFLFLLIPCLLILNGCTSKLDEHYTQEMEPHYYDWLKQPAGDQSDAWLSNKLNPIEKNMRKDGYDGAAIKAIKNEAKNRSFNLISVLRNSH
jgi:hypothetical protein